MEITQVETPIKPRKKLLYKNLQPNDTFLMHGDKDVRIKTEDGHIGFHGRDYYHDGLKISIYRNNHNNFNDTVVRLIDVDLQWNERGDA